MTTEEFLNSYVTLAEHSVLHLIPTGAKVTVGLTREEAEKLTHQLKPMPTGTVNNTAKEILLLCTGQRTVREITQELLKRADAIEYKNKEQLQAGILAFIQQALKYHVVVLHKLPQNKPVRTTGSPDFFIPQHLSFELVEHCNLKCYYCYKSADAIKKPYLSGKEIIRILQDLSDRGLRSIELTGGEPTIHPDFYDIFHFSARQFARVSVLTNGTRLNNRIARLMGKYKNTIIVQTDLDGSTPEMHDKIRGAARAFARVVQGIKLLASYGVNVRVAMNVTKENLYDIEKTLILAKTLGATWFTFSLVMDYGRGKWIDTTYTKEELQYMETLKHRLRKEYGSFFNYITEEQVQNVFSSHSKNCGAGYRAVVIGPTGKVRPCPILPEEYLTIGDLHQEGIEKVFSNPVVSYLAQLELPSSTTCQNCHNELYCRGCHARGIFTQSRLKSPCNWVLSNQLDQRFSLQVGRELQNDMCKITNISCA